MAVTTLETRVGKIHVVRPDDNPDLVYLRAEVGSAAELAAPAHFLRAALAGNRFGLQTGGGTLSLGPDETPVIYLTLRTTAEVADDPAALEAELQGFAATLHLWRERFDLEAKMPVAEEEEHERA